LLIACCYWKRANNWGAAAAIAMGAVMPVLYLVLEQVPATSAWVRANVGPYYSGIAAYLLAAAAMVAGSLLKPAARKETP
jgi:SSS family solute:Na+ symporter